MFLRKIKKKEKIIQSFELLGWLLAADLTMLDSIQVLCRFIKMLYTDRFRYPFLFRKYEKYWFLNELWLHIEDGIVEGATLSACVRGHKLIDSDIVNRIVKGEDNGNLPITLIQIDRDEIDEEEDGSQYRETSSVVVKIVNEILENGFDQKAKKIALPSLPDGETPFQDEPMIHACQKGDVNSFKVPEKNTRKGMYNFDGLIGDFEDASGAVQDEFPVYFQIEDKWHLYYKMPRYLSQTINRLLLMSGIQYWTKFESEGVIKYWNYGIGRMEIKVNYYPESQRVILNIIKRKKLTSKS